MSIIKRILGLEAKKTSLEVQKENLKQLGQETDDVSLNISLSSILIYSAKTKKRLYD